MKSCLLCLQNITEYNNYIPVQSLQWDQFQVLNIIEKHFWPMESVSEGICQRCWSHLYEFHQFYIAVEEAHLNAIQMDNKHQSLVTIPSATPCILKVESLPNDDIITDSYSAEMETLITAKPKKKRGRPRKIHCLNYAVEQLKKPKGKVGRPPKKFNQITENNPSSKRKKGSRVKKKYAMETSTETETNKNKKPKGKVGRPRKHFREINDLPPTSHSNTMTGSHVETNEAMVQLSATDNLIQPLKPRKRGRPFKKKPNQQPQDVVNETIDISVPTVAFEESTIDSMIPMVQLNTDSCCIEHSEDLLSEVVPLNDDNGLQKNKKLDFKNIFKKRQRIKQHKDQMRNYIATSVRCMKFVKN